MKLLLVPAILFTSACASVAFSASPKQTVHCLMPYQSESPQITIEFEEVAGLPKVSSISTAYCPVEDPSNCTASSMYVSYFTSRVTANKDVPFSRVIAKYKNGTIDIYSLDGLNSRGQITGEKIMYPDLSGPTPNFMQIECYKDTKNTGK